MSTLNLINNPVAKPEEKEEVEQFDSEFSSEMVEKLYLNETMVDFHFTFESGDRIPAHKFLLSAGSDVFKSIFERFWKDKSEEKLIGISVGAVKEFLQFFYLKKAKLTMANIGDVMRLCKKYNMIKCTSVCGNFLKNKLNDENVCWAYELAITCDENELKKYCERIIGYNTTSVFASDGFKTCSREVLSSLLEINEMMYCPEIEIFEACMTWVKGVSKQENLTKDIVKETLGDLFYKIRFGSMTLKDFGQIYVSYGNVFTADDYNKILQVTMPGETHSQLLCEARQQSKSKAITWKPEDLIRCLRNVSHTLHLYRMMTIKHSPYFIKSIETTTFTSNISRTLVALTPATLEIHGKRFHLPIKDDIPTEVTIIEIDPLNSSEKVILSKDKTIIPSKSPFYITLSKFIFIKPKFMYKIQLEQTPPENCKVSNVNKSKVNMFDGTVEFFDETIEHEDETGKYSKGLIAGLQFMNPKSNSAKNKLPYSGLDYDLDLY